jgi:hypothetical protein
VRGDDDLAAGRSEVVQQSDEAEAGHERKRGVWFVHEIEPGLVDPGAQDLQEPLAMAELVEPLGRRPGFSSR